MYYVKISAESCHTYFISYSKMLCLRKHSINSVQYGYCLKINMKASVIKNEVNAAIHFVTFLKRSLNLAVNNPALNGSLENVKDITFQEGTLTKINADRNKKTTVNIQEGLPFTLEDVRRQKEDSQLLKRVSYFVLYEFLS